jgi:hypothetical protein
VVGDRGVRLEVEADEAEHGEERGHGEERRRDQPRGTTAREQDGGSDRRG